MKKMDLLDIYFGRSKYGHKKNLNTLGDIQVKTMLYFPQNSYWKWKLLMKLNRTKCGVVYVIMKYFKKVHIFK